MGSSPTDGSIFVIGKFSCICVILIRMSTDRNFFSISRNKFTVDADGPNPHEVTELPSYNIFRPLDGAKNYSDILKFSDQQGFTLIGCQVDQGKEDSVDINNFCREITLDGKFGIGGGGNQVITIKGGCDTVWVTGTSYGNRIEIGNWSDQTYNKSKNIVLNIASANGQPIKVYIGRAENVSCQGNCKKDTFGSLKITAYWWFKWIIRRILGIKVGQSGPSWL